MAFNKIFTIQLQQTGNDTVKKFMQKIQLLYKGQGNAFISNKLTWQGGISKF